MLQRPSDVLFSHYRRRVLSLLLLHPEKAYHVREIARLTGTVAGTLHKELSKLGDAGILSRERRGNQILYCANRSSPIYEELASIMRKTAGLADVLAEALAPLSKGIEAAFIYGSVARARESAASDVDVMIIGSISFADAVRALYEAQTTIGREINPKVLTPSEWTDAIRNLEPFLIDVMGKPKIFLIGNDHDIAELARR
ncbi:ArsR family transcriptional regulator [Trinickia symbiotica]|uniref:DNA polymerase subunit beta n=1 Tax=Trinickia symbiotica TaxID=863227 RepID=A0A2N7X3C2_9BURK|nr:hypothetical protein [Trinickia symbiotica]PMS36114.1 DNA polymerase subunit beta [Trinickia symbiotica]PPK45803.1 ArsR family transcriptional regulator [Trinickia symbiotica]